MKINFKKTYTGILVLTFFMSGLLWTANAQSSRSFTISPPTLQFTLKPGQKTERPVKITNHSEETLEFVANVMDFVVKDKAGTPELLPPTEVPAKYAASSWSTVLPDMITVPPGKTVTTTLYLQVPGDARPGGRYFAVTFRPIGSPGSATTGAAVNSVVGSLVYLTVSGKVKEEARIVSFSAPSLSEYGPVKINTEIKNLGDMHITPKGVIEIKNLLGKKVFSTALSNINIFPGTSRVYENIWSQKWLLGRYQASLSGYFGQEENLSLIAMATFWVIPYKLIAIILLAILIGAVAFIYFRKKQEAEEAEE